MMSSPGVNYVSSVANVSVMTQSLIGAAVCGHRREWHQAMLGATPAVTEASPAWHKQNALAGAAASAAAAGEATPQWLGRLSQQQPQWLQQAPQRHAPPLQGGAPSCFQLPPAPPLTQRQASAGPIGVGPCLHDGPPTPLLPPIQSRSKLPQQARQQQQPPPSQSPGSELPFWGGSAGAPSAGWSPAPPSWGDFSGIAGYGHGGPAAAAGGAQQQ